MGIGQRLGFLLQITRSHGIARRYFVVNGFDGALTMLGLLMGFHVSGPADLRLVIGACVGAGVALGMSGLSSAYISERAERRRDLARLEGAMVTDLRESAYGEAARQVPLMIALVNGLAPVLVSLLILSPLFVATSAVSMPLPPLMSAIVMALVIVFALGAFLGHIGRGFWLFSGLQALVVALCTVGLVFVLSP
jgi:predicted membrane protein (TIGR00267 family)